METENYSCCDDAFQPISIRSANSVIPLTHTQMKYFVMQACVVWKALVCDFHLIWFDWKVFITFVEFYSFWMFGQMENSVAFHSVFWAIWSFLSKFKRTVEFIVGKIFWPKSPNESAFSRQPMIPCLSAATLKKKCDNNCAGLFKLIPLHVNFSFAFECFFFLLLFISSHLLKLQWIKPVNENFCHPSN